MASSTGAGGGNGARCGGRERVGGPPARRRPAGRLGRLGRLAGPAENSSTFFETGDAPTINTTFLAGATPRLKTFSAFMVAALLFPAGRPPAGRPLKNPGGHFRAGPVPERIFWGPRNGPELGPNWARNGPRNGPKMDPQIPHFIKESLMKWGNGGSRNGPISGPISDPVLSKRGSISGPQKNPVWAGKVQ